jgi:PPOX class probable F420-dependent enzyme
MTEPLSFDDLAQARYVRLTTFRRTGEPVSTPVWITPRGDRLVVVTEERSGKVKRLRNDPRVVLGPSDWRGTPKGGERSGTVELLGADVVDEQTEVARRKYGLEYRLLLLAERVRRAGQHPRVALAITLDAEGSDAPAS